MVVKMNRIQKKAAIDTAVFMLVVTTLPFIMISILVHVPLVYLGIFACSMLLAFMVKMMYDIRVKQLEWAEKYGNES